MLLQTGPRFVVPFAFNVAFGLLLVLAGVALYVRFGTAISVPPLAVRAAAAALAGFGLGLVALALFLGGAAATLLAVAVAIRAELGRAS